MKKTVIHEKGEERLPWEPMVVTEVGRLGDLMQGNTGSNGETMGGMMA